MEVPLGTAESPQRYRRDGLRYPSDLTDVEWARLRLSLVGR